VALGFVSLPRPERIWGPHKLQSSKYHGLSSEIKRPERGTDQ